ncbi:MAG: DOPA 4,5-dioxygenase family protein [Pseudomonadota bacterium]
MDRVRSYHAHIYFDAATRDDAREICREAGENFPVQIGRFHEQPVGPHPMASCQIAFGQAVFAEIVPWLALNRRNLIVFLHPETGDELSDHTSHAIWMGQMIDLDLSVFKQD